MSRSIWTEGRTNGQANTIQLIVAFSNFSKPPKNNQVP